MGAHGESESAFVFALEGKEDSWGLGAGGGGDWMVGNGVGLFGLVWVACVGSRFVVSATGG